MPTIQRPRTKILQRRSAIIGAALLACLLAANAKPNPMAQAPKIILHVSYADLAFKKAPDGTFPVLVRLRGASSFHTLPVAAGATDFHTVDNQISAGNPFSPIKVRAVISGAEEGSLAIWLRPVRSDAGICALVEEEFGFEHVKRNHTLICAYNGKQNALWFKEAGDFPYGPTLTAVAIKNPPNGSAAELVYYEASTKPEGPDTFEVRAFTVTKTKLQPLIRPVQTITAAVFASVEEARKARDAAPNKACRYFWAVQNADGQFALTARTIDENVESFLFWKDWRECYPNLKVSDNR